MWPFFEVLKQNRIKLNKMHEFKQAELFSLKKKKSEIVGIEMKLIEFQSILI